MLVDERIVKKMYSYHRRANRRCLKATAFVAHCQSLTSESTMADKQKVYDRLKTALVGILPIEQRQEIERVWAQEAPLTVVNMLRSLCATYMATILITGSELNKGPAYAGGRKRTR